MVYCIVECSDVYSDRFSDWRHLEYPGEARICANESIYIMKVVIAIDSFKNSMSSLDAGYAAAEGVRKAYGEEPVNIVVKPLADGGEGTVDALVMGMNGEYRHVTVSGPLEDRVDCVYGYLPETNTAIIEMSGAAGIGLVPETDRNPLNTSTYGVGEVIRDAMDSGIRNFIVGLGGSATNDCGMGMLQALGYVFYDKDGNPVGRGGKALKDVARIDVSRVPEELKECHFKVACDVNNPLCGPNGCSYVYGPQKGADPEMVQTLDGYCAHFGEVTAETLGNDFRETEGAGAAGGMGFAFLSYLNADLEPGIDIVIREVRLEQELMDADYLITGEGRLDFQTAMGKGPIGVAKMAKKYGVKTIGLAGGVTKEAGKCNAQGLDAFFSVVPGVMTLEDAMKHDVAVENMTRTAEQVFRLIRAAAFFS